MTAVESRSPADIPLHIRNEAAAWIMQLHAADRTPSADSALRNWLSQSKTHREAFEIASDLWNAGATLPVSTIGRIARSGPRERLSPRRAWLAAAALACCALVAEFVYQSRDRSLTTVVGEQRSMTLEDGTHVTLNTATRLKLAYESSVRQVVLESGEALFEVAKDPHRPFVVTVADREVTALGTSFIVRHENERTAVTLVEGKVIVASRGSSAGNARDAGRAITILQPGERLTFDAHAHPTLDRPALEKVRAWERRQAAFQNTSLLDAIEEMNRYSKKKLVIGDSTAAAVRVSGIFRVGESEIFALALRNTYPLRIAEQGDSLVIYGMPEGNP
jgi:transmembrane sensor